MIVLHEYRTAIMSPPKCGTHALHAGLALIPFRGLCYCGPSRSADANANYYDWHTHIWPYDILNYKKLIVVRCPFQRLVSLYAHHCGECSGLGQPAPSFNGFMVAIKEKAYAPFYCNTMSDYFADVEYDVVIRHETMLTDLAANGLEVRKLPILNRSILRKPHYRFYDEQTLPIAVQWAVEDCEKFGYSTPAELLSKASFEKSSPAE